MISTEQNNITYQVESFSDIWEEIQEILNIHFEEIEYANLIGNMNIKQDWYELLCSNDSLLIATARHNNKLNVEAYNPNGEGHQNNNIIAYASYIIFPSMHNQEKIMAENDAYFLLPEYRKGFEGYNFLKFAEKELMKKGVNIVTQKVKVNNDCSSIFKRMKYTCNEHLYVKEL